MDQNSHNVKVSLLNTFYTFYSSFQEQETGYSKKKTRELEIQM